jgi:hypothetical protein
MNNFDEILEQCLDKIASGESTLEECLAHNPVHAAELQPLLAAAEHLKRGREVGPSPFFAARLRSELAQKTQSRPKTVWGFPVFFQRMAVNMAILFLLFAFTSTAFAQSALPGETLYGLKLTSESVWRVVTTDPVGTDLKISERRIHEYMAVSRDEIRRARVLNGYHDLMLRLQAQEDEQEKTRILQTLKTHQDSLRKVGLSIPELDQYFAGGATETGGEFPLATPDAPIERPTPKK